jgi:hypothetical protein
MDLLQIPDKNQQLLVVAWFISAFVPNFMRPLLNPYGEKGSGKSFLTIAPVQITDPTSIDSRTQDVRILAQPKDYDTIASVLSNRHVVAYDNIAYIFLDFAHLLSVAVTGGETQKKRLYTNNEPYAVSFKRPCIIINGVHLLDLQYTDLHDRIMPISLVHKEEREILTEEAFFNVLEHIRPHVLRAIFTTLSKAMALRPGIRIVNKSRFADFEVWGCSVAIALGHSQEEFLTAWRENRDLENYQIIGEHPVAQGVLALLKGKGEWKGMPTELLHELDTATRIINIDPTQKLWPRAANVLTQRLNEIKGNLRDIGILYDEGEKFTRLSNSAEGKKGTTQKVIHLRRIPSCPSL